MHKLDIYSITRVLFILPRYGTSALSKFCPDTEGLLVVGDCMGLNDEMHDAETVETGKDKDEMNLIPEPLVLSPIPEIPTKTLVTTALSSPPIITTISLVQQQQIAPIPTTPIPTPPITIEAPTFTTAVPETPTITTIAFIVVQLRVIELEKEVFELKQVDHSAKFLAFIQSQVPSVVNAYLGTSLGDSLQKLYDALTWSIKLDENNSTRGRNPDTVLKKIDLGDDQDEDHPTGPNHGKKTKRRRTKESESSKKASTTKETSKGKAPTKGSKASKSAIAEELVEEPITEVVMDDVVNTAAEDLVHDVDQPQDASEQKIDKTPKYNWFTQPLRPPTLDPEWNTILGVKSVSVKKLHGYGHLEEIVVKRADRHLYKFKEGDFVNLHLNDIEDMLLLAVQHKLFHLDGSDIIDIIVALRMLIRSLIIKRCVEDLQLGVENGTLKTVRDELHYRILDFRLGYNNEMSRRKWTATDKRRSELMVELIDKQIWERRIIRNLERLFGARELEMDYKLMTRTV
ncbi:hypothetical protein Tco_0066452 [Tanacetum coccineum]